MGLFDKIKNALALKSARKEIEKNPILRAALLRQAALNTAKPLFKARFSGETKKQSASDLLADIYEIIVSADKVIKCREFLADAVAQRAKYGVLLIPPEPNEDWSRLRGTQGVTGELKSHLLEISQKDDILKQVIYGAYEEPPTHDLVLHAVELLYQKYFWRSEIFDACRRELKDFNTIETRDWYKPFIHAMFVWQESEFRQILEMPSAIPVPDEGKYLPEAHALAIQLSYFNFYDTVLSGVKFPDLEWKDRFADDIKDGLLQPVYSDVEKDEFDFSNPEEDRIEYEKRMEREKMKKRE